MVNNFNKLRIIWNVNMFVYYNGCIMHTVNITILIILTNCAYWNDHG